MHTLMKVYIHTNQYPIGAPLIKVYIHTDKVYIHSHIRIRQESNALLKIRSKTAEDVIVDRFGRTIPGGASRNWQSADGPRKGRRHHSRSRGRQRGESSSMVTQPHTYIRTHTFTYVRTYTYIHTCVHIRTNTYTHNVKMLNTDK